MARYLHNKLFKPTLSIDKTNSSIDNIGLSIDKLTISTDNRQNEPILSLIIY